MCKDFGFPARLSTKNCSLAAALFIASFSLPDNLHIEILIVLLLPTEPCKWTPLSLCHQFSQFSDLTPTVVWFTNAFHSNDPVHMSISEMKWSSAFRRARKMSAIERCQFITNDSTHWCSNFDTWHDSRQMYVPLFKIEFPSPYWSSCLSHSTFNFYTHIQCNSLSQVQSNQFNSIGSLCFTAHIVETGTTECPRRFRWQYERNKFSAYRKSQFR